MGFSRSAPRRLPARLPCGGGGPGRRRGLALGPLPRPLCPFHLASPPPLLFPPLVRYLAQLRTAPAALPPSRSLFPLRLPPPPSPLPGRALAVIRPYYADSPRHKKPPAGSRGPRLLGRRVSAAGRSPGPRVQLGHSVSGCGGPGCSELTPVLRDPLAGTRKKKITNQKETMKNVSQ